MIFTLPQNGLIYLYLYIVSNFAINFLSLEPYLTPYFLEIPTFYVLLVIVIKDLEISFLLNNFYRKIKSFS